MTARPATIPIWAAPACEAVVSGECERALLFCGTGIGISIAANKVPGIRAACCSDYFSAKFTRMHNDANALCMGGRVIGPGLADRAGRRLSPHRIRGRTPPAPHRQDFRFGKQVIHHTISTDRGT